MLLIGLTPSGMTELNTTIHHDYMDAVIRAGALPVMLPLTTDKETIIRSLQMVDGVIVTGGVDVHPKYYHEELLPCCGTICEKRDIMEDIVLRYALETDMPILCICRGMQYINCVTGGTLYQDIPEQYSRELCHSRSDHPFDPVHDAAVVPGTLLHSILGKETVAVNSRHHQAVKAPSPLCRVSATAPDGVVEAIEFPDKHFALGVQWHPESLSDRYEDHHKLFLAFMKACEAKK